MVADAAGECRLDFAVIKAALEDYLDPVLSSRRTATPPARGLLALSRQYQDFALHWTDVIRRSNAEMAFQFISRAPLALTLMGTAGAREWLLQAMAVYDREGLYPGSAAFDKVEAFARGYRLRHITVTLEEVRNVLATMVCGLSGRALKIEAGQSLYTDTETLYLPPALNRFDNKEQNYQLYKVMAVQLWAQNWFGTFKRSAPDAPSLRDRLAELGDSHRVVQLFNRLETYRLNACIARELPGLAREMGLLDPRPSVHDATLRAAIARLEQPLASVEDTLTLTAALYERQLLLPAAFIYQAELDLVAVGETQAQRLQANEQELKTAIEELLRRLTADGEGSGDANDDDLVLSQNDAGEPELALNGEPVALPPSLEALLDSLLQDLDNIPDHWLEGEGGVGDDCAPADAPGDSRFKPDTDTLFYDEWDFRRQAYRKNWCGLKEHAATPVADDFGDRTLAKYAPLVSEIRRHFETLRGEDRILKARSVGDDIDFDALITAHADMHTGVEMTDRLYAQLTRQERDLAVIFMVDVSGSTKGWINEAERESLVLLCQALEILGDQYAIYGFSGMTRSRCEVYRVKTFAEAYNNEVKARISGLRPRDYTRMGVVIRHLSTILSRVEARTRLLITLSDGKPDDYDGYRGEYGIEDTRQALLEARHHGIHPFCITIDTEGEHYLPHMYGHASYVVVDEVRKLPLKVADIYRRLTT